MNVGLVIPVHNRRELTLACLRRLRADGVLGWAEAIVVDDGSTDGTADAVRAEFPEAVLLRGDGRLWWTGATALGMSEALTRGARHIFWLNDDCAPAPGACRRLLDTATRTGTVVTGVCRVEPAGLVVYGGLRRGRIGLQLVTDLGDDLTACDAACGNFVCFPRAVVEALSLPDARRFPHAHGDTDYTLRATAQGFRVCIDPQARAEARPNALRNHASWLHGDISLAEMWSGLWQVRSYSYFPTHFRYLARHFGWRGAAFCLWTVAKRVPITAVRLLVPRAWRQRWWGHTSAVWQEEKRLHAALAEPPAATTPYSGNQPPTQPGHAK
ncbi:MAG: glycosyltransferase family 2 protein [Opitutae bacterium]|nr:glycosyltransferase family 2 protein [Opitutae bacterium]